MYPFLPGNKILLNKDNHDNTQTTDTSLSEKYDMSHISPYYFTEKQTTKKLQIRDHRKLKKERKVLMMMKYQILCVMILLSIQPKK